MMSEYTTVLFSGINMCRFSRKAAHDQMRSNDTTFQSLSHHVKAKLLVNIFILTISETAMCCVKGVSRSDEPTEDDQFNSFRQLCRAFYPLSAPCFGFMGYLLFSPVSALSSTFFPAAAGSCFFILIKQALVSPLPHYTTCSAPKQQTETETSRSNQTVFISRSSNTDVLLRPWMNQAFN